MTETFPQDDVTRYDRSVPPFLRLPAYYSEGRRLVNKSYIGLKSEACARIAKRLNDVLKSA